MSPFKPFYNRLQARLSVLEKVGLHLPLGQGTIEDVEWLVASYRTDSLNGIPMDQFAYVRQPDHIINMDASDLCRTQGRSILASAGTRQSKI